MEKGENVKTKLITIVLAAVSLCASAFSPYEEYLRSGETTRVGLIAAAKPGQEEALANALQSLTEKKIAKALKKKKITNLSSYSVPILGKTWVMVYFDYDGKDYLQAAADIEQVEVFQGLEKWVEPHPRAARYGTKWLQMEWITYLHASQKEVAGDPFAMVTRIKPEKEQEYRMLHQTVWPGVVDQMARGNYRNFSIFLVEIGDEIFEFAYGEYVGTDSKKDGEMNSTDPCNLRWWKITDACQNPLPGADGIWLMMKKTDGEE